MYTKINKDEAYNAMISGKTIQDEWGYNWWYNKDRKRIEYTVDMSDPEWGPAADTWHMSAEEFFDDDTYKEFYMENE